MQALGASSRVCARPSITARPSRASVKPMALFGMGTASKGSELYDITVSARLTADQTEVAQGRGADIGAVQIASKEL